MVKPNLASNREQDVLPAIGLHLVHLFLVLHETNFPSERKFGIHKNKLQPKKLPEGANL